MKEPVVICLGAGKAQVPLIQTAKNIVETRSMEFKQGKILSIRGLNEIENRNDVLLVNSRLEVGRRIEKRTSNYNHHLRITFSGKDNRDTSNIWVSICNTIEVVTK